MDNEAKQSSGQYGDIITALVLLVVGVGFTVVAYGYGLGELRRIGPGAMPFLIGCAFSICSFICFITAFRRRIEIEVSPPVPVIMVLGAVIAWALLVKPFGLVLATAVLMLIGTRAYGPVRWVSSGIVIVCMCIGCVALFIYGFRLPFTVFGG